MPTYLKKRQKNTLNKKCVSCYQSLMCCRICERTNKAVEATRLSQKTSSLTLGTLVCTLCNKYRAANASMDQESEKVAYFEPTPTNCRRRPSFEKE